MRVPALPVAILLMLIALSCSKDGSPFPLETAVVYKKKHISPAAPVRVFAQSGEIKTATILASFASRDNGTFVNLSDQLYPNQSRIDNFKVLGEQVIDVNDNYQYLLYNVKRKGDNITLTAKDTAKYMSYNEVFTKTIFYTIALYKPPIYYETLVSSVRGFYCFEYASQKQYHLEPYMKGINLPWILGEVHYANGSTTSLLLQNKIDVNFHKTLAPGDTVVLREYVVRYEK
jgi:hypothetical protein